MRTRFQGAITLPARTCDLGQWGEDMACTYLENKGYRILERNWRTRDGELDIICSHNGELVFVEVKTRGPGSLGKPGEALHTAKQSRLVKAACAYVSRSHAWETPARFDFIGLQLDQDAVQVEHEHNVIDAWETMGGGHASWQPW
ncbi:MAG: YraN family protein [Desulfobacterales bacterium]|nr:MAG: YraN family protein [Desulfobacterales bacterium]